MAELDSDSRAILDLSLRYGFSDERLATMLQIGLEEVALRREEALFALADQAGVDPGADRPRLEHALRQVPHETWIGRELSDPDTEPDPAAPAAAPGESPSTARRPSRRLIVALFGLAALIALIVLIVPGRSDQAEDANAPGVERITGPPPGGDASASAGADRRADGTAAAAGGTGSVALKPILGAAPARATVRLLEAGPPARVALSLRTPSPQPGIYEVWLYDTVIDAAPVARIPHGGGTVRFTLPESASRYRYLDVSEEKPGGFTGHSGRSVERIGIPAALAGLGLSNG